MKSDNEIGDPPPPHLDNLFALQVRLDDQLKDIYYKDLLSNLLTQGLGLKTKYYQNTLGKPTNEIGS
jgi:hypothetical protein